MGTYLIPLGHAGDLNVHAIYEVSLVEGSKVLNLRSNILIINETALPLLVEVERLNMMQHYNVPSIGIV